MALEMDFKSTIGQIFNRVYFTIDEYSCDKKEIVRAKIRGYITRDLSKSGASPLEGSETIVELTVDYSDEATNSKKQIYEKLRTLPEFENAVDVLE